MSSRCHPGHFETALGRTFCPLADLEDAGAYFVVLSFFKSHLIFQGVTYYLDVIPEDALIQAMDSFQEPVVSENADGDLPELLEALDIDALN